MPTCPGTTPSPQYVRTCMRWPVTATQQSPATAPPRAVRRACASSGTRRPKRPGYTPTPHVPWTPARPTTRCRGVIRAAERSPPPVDQCDGLHAWPVGDRRSAAVPERGYQATRSPLLSPIDSSTAGSNSRPGVNTPLSIMPVRPPQAQAAARFRPDGSAGSCRKPALGRSV
jgi:hypothetical protein